MLSAVKCYRNKCDGSEVFQQGRFYTCRKCGARTTEENLASFGVAPATKYETPADEVKFEGFSGQEGRTVGY